MQKEHSHSIKFILILIVLGQIAFAFVSPSFTAPHYESRIYATTGVKHDSSDLHKLNEAAHYFGQTMIGWTKFPNFMNKLQLAADLPGDSSINAHIQERQNIIFTVSTKKPITSENVIAVKDYIQLQMDEYNSVNQTEFNLSNLDYENAKIQRSYRFGAMVTLIVSLILGMAVLFVRKELFRQP